LQIVSALADAVADLRISACGTLPVDVTANFPIPVKFPHVGFPPLRTQLRTQSVTADFLVAELRIFSAPADFRICG
jgi:hypothetical protein